MMSGKDQMNRSLNKLIFCSMIGTILEWYDFFIFGALSPVIARIFFQNNDVTNLINTFGIFAIGFAARPLGSLLWGHVGDTLGRKKALLYSILTMSISTTVIGLLGSYEKIGIMAPIALVILRIIQGVAASGEHSGSLVLIRESTMESNNGFYTSICLSSVYIGMILANLSALFVSSELTKEQLYDWGWRLPFLISFFLGYIGYYMRAKIDETYFFKNILLKNQIFKIPVFSLIKEKWLITVLGIGIFQLAVTIPYIIFVFLPSYVNNNVKLYSNSAALAITALLILVFGMISRIEARIKLMKISAVLTLIFSIPLIQMIELDSNAGFFFVQFFFAIVCSIFVGAVGSFITDIFPVQIRYTGVAICFNVAATFFGGIAPFISSVLVYKTGQLEFSGYYLVVSSIIALTCLLTFTKLRLYESYEF